MTKERMTLLKWTGRGRLADLESSVAFILRDRGVRGKVRKSGASLVVVGPDPTGVAAITEYLPGIAWIAVGFEVGGFNELGPTAGDLAKKYLRRGERFGVEAEGSGGVARSDIGGAVTSGIIDGVKGVSVSEKPKVWFRAAFDGGRGVVGVELRTGPGGVPTGRDGAACLISGGRHSSVVAWWAALAGYRVNLVHLVSSEESLLAAARLYSELSYRIDPRPLELSAVEGGSIPELLAGLGEGGPVFAGFHQGGVRIPGWLRARVTAPLFLLPEEIFTSEHGSLRVKEERSAMTWTPGSGAGTVRRFGGRSADVSEVLDRLA